MKKCFFARPKCHASIHRSNKTTKQSNALKDEMTIVSPIKEKSMMSTELDLRLQSPEWEEGGPKSWKWFKIKHLKSSWPDLRSKIQCGLLVTWVMWRTRPKEEKSRVLVELTWKKRICVTYKWWWWRGWDSLDLDDGNKVIMIKLTMVVKNRYEVWSL